MRFLDAPVSGGVGGANRRHARDHGRRGCRRPRRSPAGARRDGRQPSSMSERSAPARVAKLCNNLISGSALVAVAEAFRIGEAFGVDPEILTRVIAKSSGATWVMEHMHPVPGIVDGAASNRQYAPGFNDRPDGEGSRPRSQRAARKARACRRGAGRSAALSHGVLARAWPRGFLVGLQVPEAVERRRPGLML